MIIEVLVTADGTLHAHRHGCPAILQSKYAGVTPRTVNSPDLRGAVLAIYDPDDFGYDPDEWDAWLGPDDHADPTPGNLGIHPCLSDLPRGAVMEVSPRQLAVLLAAEAGRLERSTAGDDFGDLFEIDDRGTRHRVAAATTAALWAAAVLTGADDQTDDDKARRRERVKPSILGEQAIAAAGHDPSKEAS